MSIKLNGGSNPTSVKYNGTTVYKVMYKTSSTATPTAVWAKPFTVNFIIPGGGTVSNYSSDVGFNSTGNRVSNGYVWTETCYAYWGDTFHVSWDDWWMDTVLDPVLMYEAGSMDIVITGDVIVDATSSGGGSGSNIEPSADWITDYGIVDYDTYTISAAIQCPAMPPSTTTTTYDIAGKTGSHTGDVTSGTSVTHTFRPSITTKEFVCTVDYEVYATQTEKISNPFYHSSGRPDKPTITLVSATGTQIKYTVYNPNNHPIRLEYGAEEAWGVDEVTVSAKSSKTFTQAVSGNWQEIELCADAYACGKWSGYTYLTVTNPNYVQPIKAPTLSGSIQNGVLNDNGTDYVNYISLTIHNPNNYQVTATMELWTSTEGNDTYTQTIAANRSWHFYEEYSNQNAEADITVYFTANGQQSSETLYLEGSTG